jgi:hypothetical protein
MKIAVTYIQYSEREYVSKKTGEKGIARELQCLTDDADLVVFGYGTLAKEITAEDFADIPRGSEIVLDCLLRGDKYNRTRPTILVSAVSAR